MSLLLKLRFSPDHPVHLLGDADGVALMGNEEGYAISKSVPAGEDSIQQMLLFARAAAALEKSFSDLVPRLAEGALLWIAYPRKSGSIRSDLTRHVGWKVVSEYDYIGVSQASLDADWSALCLKNARPSGATCAVR